MIVVLFGYGLVFFLMGFAITLQSRHESRMTLARSLPLLGTFGILHGIAEWSHVFIPIQSLYLSEEVIAVLKGLATTLLALAFVALFSFGARLLADMTGRFRWLSWVPVALFAGWLMSFLIIGIGMRGGEYSWWLAAGDLWSRYLLAFFGALITCYALLLQAEELRERNMEALLPHLRVGVFSFALYAVAGGLMVPASPFFPANVLNSDVFFQLTGLPIQIPRAIAGLFMAYSIVRILEIFDIESARRLEEAERTRAIWQERDRIARELHDGIIQSLYAVGLNLETAEYLMMKQPEEAQQRLQVVMKNLNRSIRDIRNYIMDLKTVPDHRLSLEDRLQALVQELSTSYHRPIRLELDAPHLPEWTEEAANHLRQIVREAVANAVRHGSAQNITVRLTQKGSDLSLEIQDDGRGFDPLVSQREPGSGNGLHNMEHRARQLGGTFSVSSRPGEGTIVRILIPHPEDFSAHPREHGPQASGIGAGRPGTKGSQRGWFALF